MLLHGAGGWGSGKGDGVLLLVLVPCQRIFMNVGGGAFEAVLKGGVCLFCCSPELMTPPLKENDIVTFISLQRCPFTQ